MYPSNKPHKSKILKIENDVLKMGAVPHVAHFTKSLQNIANNVQIKYNSDVAEAIRTIETPTFGYPEKPMITYLKYELGKVMEVKLDEFNIFIWRRLWEEENDQAFEYKKYKSVYSLIIGQCLLALRVQQEGMKGYEKVNKNQDVLIFG